MLQINYDIFISNSYWKFSVLILFVTFKLVSAIRNCLTHRGVVMPDIIIEHNFILIC